jgi:hypothetical protein
VKGYHAELMLIAGELAVKDRQRPRQACLRRSVSTSYYALFHLLIDEATRMMFCASHAVRGQRQAIARGFDHASMGDVCRSFSGGNLPRPLARAIGSAGIAGDLRLVAQAFLDLQEQRHEADYDLRRSFRKSDAINALGQLLSAFGAWDRVRKDDTRRLFLMALSMGKQLGRR